MFSAPELVHRYYSVEADARDSRFTRKCNPPVGQPCSFGPLMRGDQNVEIFEWPAALVDGTKQDVGELLLMEINNLNNNATKDDILAWAFAARWWNAYCWRMYEQAVAVAPGIKLKGWPKNGPADPRLAPKVEYWFSQDGYEGATNLGGSFFLRGQMVVTNTWPLYLGSLNAQIIAKALMGNVFDLILIQIVQRHVALVFKACCAPDAQIIDIMTNGAGLP